MPILSMRAMRCAESIISARINGATVATLHDRTSAEGAFYLATMIRPLKTARDFPSRIPL